MSFDDFLFATPTFTMGLARTFDFWGTADVYNISRSPETADALAMWADWKAVGADLLAAIREIDKEMESEAA